MAWAQVAPSAGLSLPAIYLKQESDKTQKGPM